MEPPTLFRLAVIKYRREGLLPVVRGVYQYVENRFDNDVLFRYGTSIRYLKQQHLYDAPAHPYKIIDVHTDQVEYFNKAVDTRWGLGHVKDGEWDSPDNCVPIRETTHYRGLTQHFEEGADWEDTVYYRERIYNRTLQEVSEYNARRVEYFEQLFEDIKHNGYRPNYESGHDAPEGGSRQGRLRHVHELEPIVTIGRDGGIYLNEGFHRFAIAKFLDIGEVPVNVLARHEEWQRLRERIYNTPNPESDPELRQYLSHPDVQDVVDAPRSGSPAVPLGRQTR